MNLSLAFAKFLAVMVTVWIISIEILSLDSLNAVFDFGFFGDLDFLLPLGAIVGAWAMVLVNLLGLNHRRPILCTCAVILLASFLSAIALLNFYLHVPPYFPPDFFVPIPCGAVIATTYGTLVAIYLSRKRPAKSSE